MTGLPSEVLARTIGAPRGAPESPSTRSVAKTIRGRIRHLDADRAAAGMGATIESTPHASRGRDRSTGSRTAELSRRVPVRSHIA